MNDHPELEAMTDAVLGEALHRINCVEPQLRRFGRAAADLGLPVPAEWVEVLADDTVTFSNLTLTHFDRLIRLLEDLAQSRPITVTVVQGGANLFDAGAPHGPTPAPVTSSVHMVVPQ
ncbi:MAG: hypothetical protein RLZ14_384 [Actinomycetota bacterium]|jgi:hypothetical protein